MGPIIPARFDVKGARPAKDDSLSSLLSAGHARVPLHFISLLAGRSRSTTSCKNRARSLALEISESWRRYSSARSLAVVRFRAPNIERSPWLIYSLHFLSWHHEGFGPDETILPGHSSQLVVLGNRRPQGRTIVGSRHISRSLDRLSSSSFSFPRSSRTTPKLNQTDANMVSSSDRANREARNTPFPSRPDAIPCLFDGSDQGIPKK